MWGSHRFSIVYLENTELCVHGSYIAQLFHISSVMSTNMAKHFELKQSEREGMYERIAAKRSKVLFLFKVIFC